MGGDRFGRALAGIRPVVLTSSDLRATINTRGDVTQLTISIPEDVALKLQKRAAGSGTTAPEYVAQLVADSVNKPTIDDILAPVRDDFAKSGMTEEQILDFGREVLNRVRQEKKAKSA